MIRTNEKETSYPIWNFFLQNKNELLVIVLAFALTLAKDDKIIFSGIIALIMYLLVKGKNNCEY